MRRARVAGGGGHDRISELPDPILGHILSLMPAKAATQTSVLSRRWRHLWEYIWWSPTTLDFAAEFAARQTPGDLVRNVNRYLRLHRGKKIRRFLVSLAAVDRFFPDVEAWVEFAVARDVEELWLEFPPVEQDICFYGDVANWVCGFRVPHQLFGCMPLRVLGLSNCGIPPSPGFAGLRSLQSLSLTRVDVTGDDLRSILSECRHLERLLLRHCAHCNSIKLTPPCVKLKQLVMVDCWDLFDIEISAPSLQSFHFSGQIGFENSFSDVTGLADALICSIDRTSGEPQYYIKLLSDVAHVEILTVCTATLSCVTTWSEHSPEHIPAALPNLRELQVLMDYMALDYLAYFYGFLKLCPSPLLEKLFVRFPEKNTEDSYAIGGAVVVALPPDVHFKHLRLVKMNNFKGTRCEMEMVRYLLEKAPALESLVLVAPPKPTTGAEGAVGDGQGTGRPPGLKFMEEMDMRILRGQVEALPRVSGAAQVVIREYVEDDGDVRATHNEQTCEWPEFFHTTR